MRDYSKEYEVKKMKVEQLLDLVEDNDFIFTPMAASMPQKIMNNMQYLKKTGGKKYHFTELRTDGRFSLLS